MTPWRRPRAGAAARTAAAALLVTLVSLEGALLAGQPTGPHVLVWVCGVLVCCCAIPLARVPLTVRAGAAAALSWSVTLTLLLWDPPLSVWGAGEAAALLVLLAEVLRAAPPRTAALLGAALGAGAVGVPLRDEDPGPFTLVFAVLTAAVTAACLLLRAQDGKRLRDLAAVREAERRELARELHDLVAHHVTGIAVQARAARFVSADAGQAQAALAGIEAAADRALASMRRLVGLLREQGAPTAPVAGLAEVRALADAFARTGPPVRLRISPDLPDPLSPELAAAVHRIVRESLTNVRKHAAGATSVSVAVEARAGALEVTVTDDGADAAAPPTEAGAGGGFGLVGLAERATVLGGTLTAGPLPEGGWQVTARLPPAA
ncbi:sensor histidine kinase [Kitasatospora sp. NBC_01539]|uniref:sensor histidine kinase n=1 Tax=Kitasatospora sp. NBC_01539 TaxID=2903577 RepID=UPI0038601189